MSSAKKPAPEKKNIVLVSVSLSFTTLRGVKQSRGTQGLYKMTNKYS